MGGWPAILYGYRIGNAVKQEAVVQEVAKLIQQRFTDPERLARLRAEVEFQGIQEKGTGRPTGSRLQVALAGLDRPIDQGNQNLVRIPAGLLDGVIASVRSWKEEREALARELARLDVATDVRAEQSGVVIKALEHLRQLEETITLAPPEDVRTSWRAWSSESRSSSTMARQDAIVADCLSSPLQRSRGGKKPLACLGS